MVSGNAFAQADQCRMRQPLPRTFRYPEEFCKGILTWEKPLGALQRSLTAWG